MAKILVVDDELSIVEVLRALLKRGDHIVTTANDGDEALQLLKENVYDLMITDVRLPGRDGIDLLHEAKALQTQIAVIVMTAYAGVDNAVDAMKNGAFDYITKPFKFDELMLTIERALSYEKALAENKVLKTTLKTKLHFNCMIGDSEPMLEIYRLIGKIARTNSTVLVMGESGTGKELVAQALHRSSPRTEAPFVTVNCAAIPENLLESELFGHVKGSFTGATVNRKGLFETANCGTIFLDEIGTIPINMQMKLLRVLQEKEIRRVGDSKNIPIDVRIIAATNENLEEKIARGEFRDDLYFRLSVIPIQLPALRQRKDDIPLLISYFMKAFEKENKIKLSMDNNVVKILQDFPWPGNIRQLENSINRVATLAEEGHIKSSDIPENLKNQSAANTKTDEVFVQPAVTSDTSDEVLPLKDYMRNFEESYILQVVDSFDGDKEKAAVALGVSLATLYRKIGDK